MINKEIESTLNFNFDVLGWNSPRCYPLGSPGGWIWFTKRVDNYHKNIHWKIDFDKNDWFINSRDIKLFNNWKKHRSYRSYRSLSYIQKIHKKTKWLEGSIKSGAFLRKLQKKLKLKSNDPKKHKFWNIFRWIYQKQFCLVQWLNLYFFCNFSKCAGVYRPLRSFRLLWNFV